MNLTTQEMYKKLRPKASKSKKIIISVTIVLIIIALLLFMFRDKGPEYSFITINAVKGDISSLVSATGTISATNEVLIGSQISGTINAVFVEENDTVKKGDVLAVINPDTINQNIARYQAQLNSARAVLNASQVSYENKKRNYARLKKVYAATNGQSPSKTDMDNAEMELLTAEADLKVKQAGVIEVETGLNSAKIDLKNSIITSPIDGVILRKSIDAGQTVAASFSTPELFVIAESLEKMKLLIQVSEADVGKVKEGQKVTFTVDTYPEEKFISSIYRVNKGAAPSENNVVSYETTIYVDNKDMMLRSGMSAAADIETASAKDILTIPVTALFFKPPELISEKKEDAKGVAMLSPRRRMAKPAKVTTDTPTKEAVIYVLENNMPVPRYVLLGISDGKNVEVIEGLSENEQVVIRASKNK